MKSKPKVFCIAICAIITMLLNVSSIRAGSACDESITPDRKVVYKTVGRTELKLHVFEPSNHNATSDSPAIVFFFGGGWGGGTPKQFYEQSQFLAGHGVVCFCADYRVKSRHGVSGIECVADAKSAIRWVRQHATELGVNPDQIVASGGSAGGHIAACTGVVKELDESDEDANVSSVPDAMILFNPVLDITPETGFGSHRFPTGREKEASPVHHVTTGIAPTLLFHGTSDKTVPFEQATRFAELMSDAGNRCELISFEGKGHGFFNGKFFRPKTKDTKPYHTTMKESEKFLVSLGFLEKAVEKKITKPNIVIIFTDDQGYGDVSALNPDAKFRTPNMDRLAKEGIAFTNGHSADSICTPSRYALLTGRYPWRTRMKTGVLGAEAKCLIDDKRLTLPKLLRDNGYHTAMVGKWHLGMDFPGKRGQRDWSKPVVDMPLDKGFDFFYGIPASLNYGILAWFEGRHAAVPPVLFSSKKKNSRHSDYRIMPPYEKTREETIAKRNRGGFEIAEDFVDDQCLTRFTDKALHWLDGKVADAKQGKPFFLYLPFTSPHFPVCPLPEFQGKGDCGAYGEFLIETDHHIGRVLDFLKSSGIEDNTIVIFTSDNGPENPWKEHLEDYDHDSRGGFREGKRSVYEGGHRVPFLVRWPGGIEAPGRTCDALVGQVDLMSTVAEIIAAGVPENAAEDSQSFAKVLTDPSTRHQRLPLINHGNGGESRYAITEGNWKLVLPSKKHPRTELYNLASDRAEQNDIAAKHPDKVKKLTQDINRIISRGRTTLGKAQPNDSKYWKELFWISEAEYEAQVKQRN
ncbi:sulfatase-like hydrolase/transferase [Mariniblastus fucicola]|nr:sulfatase-like hydrolase/transferase [Mariniblastus fucicola]